MPKNQTRTLKFQGRVDSPRATARLEKVLAQLGWIYDFCLLQYRMAEKQDPKLFSSKLQQRQLAGLRKDFPEFATVYRRAQAGAIDRAGINWNRYAHPREGKKPAGIPRLKGGRFRTIDIKTSSDRLLTFTRAGRPKLKIKGLPTIQLTGHRQPPRDEQPNRITITLKGRRILVRLGYRHELPPRTDPRKATNPLGADLGTALSIATSNGDAYRSPNEEKLTGQIKDAQRRLTKIISAGIATRKAGVRAILNEENHQALTGRGNPRTQVVWTDGEPPKSYLKARRLLADLHERRAVIRHDFRHRATTWIVKTALAEGCDLIVMEDLRIEQMTGSAQGTAEHPGRNVRAKSGLNRSILREGWGEILLMLEYKAERAGIPTVRVNAPGHEHHLLNVRTPGREIPEEPELISVHELRAPGQCGPQREHQHRRPGPSVLPEEARTDHRCPEIGEVILSKLGMAAGRRSRKAPPGGQSGLGAGSPDRQGYARSPKTQNPRLILQSSRNRPLLPVGTRRSAAGLREWPRLPRVGPSGMGSRHDHRGPHHVLLPGLETGEEPGRCGLKRGAKLLSQAELQAHHDLQYNSNWIKSQKAKGKSSNGTGKGQEASNGRAARKSWLARNWVTTAAGVVMALMAGATFLAMGLAAFQAEAKDVGIGYMVLAAAFPVAIMWAALWSGRN